jgi:hypothetical protein
MITIEPTPLEERAEMLRARLDGPPELLAALVEPHAGAASAAQDPSAVLAFSRDAVSSRDAIAAICRRGKPVVLGHLEPDELSDFAPIPAVEIPPRAIYALADVDLGAATRNVTPEEALKQILDEGRSPLTLEEGIALMIQQPEAIEKNWGFSMAGSRRGDQRVPAFWVSEGRPKLGWCWDRNPHTWLGTASCAARH